MALAIPCAPGTGTGTGEASRWTQRTSLAGRDYQLTFAWNTRTGHWLFSLADQDGAALVDGAVLVTGWRLLRGVVDARRPPGELVVVDTQGINDLDPGFADLGARFQLVYFDPGELPASVLP